MNESNRLPDAAPTAPASTAPPTGGSRRGKLIVLACLVVISGLGYAAFSISMACGRLLGDRISGRKPAISGEGFRLAGA